MLPINKKMWRNFDYPLVITVVIIFVFGALMVGNATGTNTTGETGWRAVLASMNTNTFRRHCIWFATGIVLAALVVFFDYEVYGEMHLYIYGGAMLLMTLVLLLGDAHWFNVGTMGIQPSELGKIALIITLAKLLSQFPDGIKSPRDLGKILLYAGIPLGLTLLQKDLGTAIVYVFIIVVMLFISGTDWKLYGGLCALGAAALPVIWRLLGTYQKNRILVFIDPSLDPLNAGYNVIMSKAAVGSGGLFGKGFFTADSLSQLRYIPVSASDFIFSVTAETTGFFISALIILLYAFLIIRMVIMSRQAFDRFGSYIIMGVCAMMAFHIFENIGMALGVMPVTGIPLPFFSYGGSSMWTNMIGMGLVINVLMRRRRGMFREGEVF